MILAVKRAAAVLAVLLIVGCGGKGSSSSASPSAKPTSSPVTSPLAFSPAASPVPLTGAFAVLVTPPSADNYTVSIVDINGKVVAAAQASSPTAVMCADAAGAVVPLPISTSDDRAYYMDAQGVVRFLTVQGETGRATTVPAGGGIRSMFAISPDDRRIAVILSQYTSAGVALKLYVEDLNGGANHLDIFSSSGATGLWPIGWHGTDNLVVAKVPACMQGGGFGCCGPQELHVVDPATATRRFTLGGPDCLIAGPPTPAGALCESTAIDFKVFDWAGNLLKQEPSGLNVRRPVYLSPNGQHIAVSDGATTHLAYEQGTLLMDVCGWIDNTHLISGGDVQQQPRVGNTATGVVVPVPAKGACAGRLPGGL